MDKQTATTLPAVNHKKKVPNPTNGATDGLASVVNTDEKKVFATTAADLVAHAKDNPLNWLLDDIVVEGGVHLLHGKELRFKTILSLQLCEALTIGGNFLAVKFQADCVLALWNWSKRTCSLDKD